MLTNYVFMVDQNKTQLNPSKGTVQGLSYKYFRPIHRGDGYNYAYSSEESQASYTA